MQMRIGFSYRITNTVLEFEPDRRITWAHLLGNRWTYELTPLDAGGTLVRETNASGPRAGRRPCRPSAAIPVSARSPSPKSLVRLKPWRSPSSQPSQGRPPRAAGAGPGRGPGSYM
jgi:hypothetical protein